MKVLLLNPPPYQKGPFVKEGRCQSRADPEFWPPITLSIIASLIRNEGYEIRLVDATVENHSESDLIDLYRDFSPDIIIHNSTTATFYDDLHAAEIAKGELNKVINVFFGTHVTALPEESLKNKAIDIVIRNEPEYSALETVKAIDSGKGLGGVKGISYRKGSEVVSNDDREFVENLDDLPFPARDLLKNEYYKVPMKNRPYTIIRTSRGCPFRCTFCTSRLYYGNRWRTRTAKSVIEEIREIKKMGINDIFFNSDTFTLRKDFVMDLCRMLKEENLEIKWFCNSRVDTIDREMAKVMKESGCWLIAFGVESGNPEILKNVKKGITLGKARETIKMVNNLGIESIVYFIFGLPGETRETIRNTIDFAKECNPTYARFFTAVPFPGTEFYDKLKKEKRIKSYDWSKYDQARCDVYDMGEVTTEDIISAEKKAFMSFYFRPRSIPKVIRNPKRSLQAGLAFFKKWVFSEE